MRYQDLFEYANKKSCIVIDIQPEYSEWIDFSVVELMQFLNNQKGKILMFVNSTDSGTFDTIPEIKYYWEENGFNPNYWNRVEVNPKGYGYFRNWMDIEIPTNIIIKVIREMYRQKVDDTSELFGGDEQQFINFLGTNEIPAEMYRLNLEGEYLDAGFLMDDSININWTSVSQLRRFNNSYLMGGGKNECLKEVTLLMNAFNIKYKMINKFIYGC